MHGFQWAHLKYFNNPTERLLFETYLERLRNVHVSRATRAKEKVYAVCNVTQWLLCDDCNVCQFYNPTILRHSCYAY